MTPPPLELPTALVEAAREQGHDSWLTSLPDTVARACDEWGLTLDPPFQPGGHTAWVAPASDAAGADLVLKVAWPHPEAEHEADALRLWQGSGAVRLREAADGDGAIVLLLERARPGTRLADEPEAVQDEVIAGLLRRLWVAPPPGHPFRDLTQMCDEWADEFEAALAAGRCDLDAGVAADGIALFRSLPRSAPREVVLCTDLHAGNVLAAQREPWLVIDPKPYVGDPAYDGLQHLLNCVDRLRADPFTVIDRFANLLGVDSERLRLWLFARCVQGSPHWPGVSELAGLLAPG